MLTQRLDKWLASHTRLSRKEAKNLIRKGQVMVNGVAASDSGMLVPESAQVMLHGEPLQLRAKVYIMLNKPAGVLSTTRDKNEVTVLDILPVELRRANLFPAGRLDRDTVGLLLITDDGPFAHRMLAPKNKVPKTYEATLDRSFDLVDLQQKFAKGVSLGGGEEASSAQLVLVQEGENPVVHLTIYEGKYHQVKRMFERFDLTVVHLKRLSIGELKLDPALPEGAARLLTAKEVAQICGK